MTNPTCPVCGRGDYETFIDSAAKYKRRRINHRSCVDCSEAARRRDVADLLERLEQAEADYQREHDEADRVVDEMMDRLQQAEAERDNWHDRASGVRELWEQAEARIKALEAGSDH